MANAQIPDSHFGDAFGLSENFSNNQSNTLARSPLKSLALSNFGDSLGDSSPLGLIEKELCANVGNVLLFIILMN